MFEDIRIGHCRDCGKEVRYMYIKPKEGTPELPVLCITCLSANAPSPQDQIKALNDYKPTNERQAAFLNKIKKSMGNGEK
jgi:hypothetical protein